MRAAGIFSLPQFRPWSLRAYLFAFAVVLFAAGCEATCLRLGFDPYFLVFLTGIFVVGIVAGAPAAAFATLVIIALTWWAFIPPVFQFSTLTMAHAHAINLFFLFSVLVIGFADLCRETMVIFGRAETRRSHENAATGS